MGYGVGVLCAVEICQKKYHNRSYNKKGRAANTNIYTKNKEISLLKKDIQ
jgi:hypothetical protein